LEDEFVPPEKLRKRRPSIFCFLGLILTKRT
jgi:hypothetical protein